MANSDNTFIIVLESSKVDIFGEQIKSKNYHFQDCKINQAFQDAVQDSKFPYFYSTKTDSQSLFCVIKISQSRFFELEKIINSHGGAIESIEWSKSNEIVTFEPTTNQNLQFDDSSNIDPVTTEPFNFINILFSTILYGVIFHCIWAGLVLITMGVVKSHKNHQENRNYIFGGAFTILVGIICNSLLGNLVTTQLGTRIGIYFEWMNDLQLIDIFSKNDTLPLNQLLAYYNLNVFTFYLITLLGLGFIFQITKYINEIIHYMKFSNLKLSTLRFYWLSTIFLFGFVSFIYFRLNITNNLFWIPVVIFILLTFLNQTGNKINSFLFGNFGILEYFRAFAKIIPFGIAAIIGISYYWSTKELNLIFNNLYLKGWDFNKALVADVVAQSIMTYIFVWISFWCIKAIIRIVK